MSIPGGGRGQGAERGGGERLAHTVQPNFLTTSHGNLLITWVYSVPVGMGRDCMVARRGTADSGIYN